MASAFGSSKSPLEYTVNTVSEKNSDDSETFQLTLEIVHHTTTIRCHTTDTGALGNAVIQAIDQFILRHLPVEYIQPLTWKEAFGSPSKDVLLVAHCINPLYSDFYNNLREALLKKAHDANATPHDDIVLEPFAYQMSVSINFAKNTIVVEYSDSGPGFPEHRFGELAELKEDEYFLYINKLKLQSGGEATLPSDKYGSGPQVAGGTGRALARPAAMLSILPGGSLHIRNGSSPEYPGARIRFSGAFRYTTEELRSAMALAKSNVSAGMPVFLKVQEQLQSILARQEIDERRAQQTLAQEPEAPTDSFLQLPKRSRERGQKPTILVLPLSASVAEETESDVSGSSDSFGSFAPGSSALFSERSSYTTPPRTANIVEALDTTGHAARRGIEIRITPPGS